MCRWRELKHGARIIRAQKASVCVRVTLFCFFLFFLEKVAVALSGQANTCLVDPLHAG